MTDRADGFWRVRLADDKHQGWTIAELRDWGEADGASLRVFDYDYAGGIPEEDWDDDVLEWGERVSMPDECMACFPRPCHCDNLAPFEVDGVRQEPPYNARTYEPPAASE